LTESRRDGWTHAEETGRPSGTLDFYDLHPALKRRAIFGLSLRDGDGLCFGTRTRHVVPG
jgi:hypothetical protein